jgi:hypothetical protein
MEVAVSMMCTKSSSICVLRKLYMVAKLNVFFPWDLKTCPKWPVKRLNLQQILVAATNRLRIFEHCGQGSKMVL